MKLTLRVNLKSEPMAFRGKESLIFIARFLSLEIKWS